MDSNRRRQGHRTWRLWTTIDMRATEEIIEEWLPNIHPGEVLRPGTASTFGLMAYRLAKDIGVGRMRVSEILNGRRDITPDTAIRLGLYFGIEAAFWLNLQAHYNLTEARLASAAQYSTIARCGKLDPAA